MVIYIGADHRGFKLKEFLKTYLNQAGYETVDFGNDHYDKDDDYPDFSIPVAQKVSEDPEKSRGILICGSGAGVDIAANRFKNVRSVLAISVEQVKMSRSDDNTNVLSLAADFLSEDQAREIADAWLKTPFSGEERYKRRLAKINDIVSH